MGGKALRLAADAELLDALPFAVFTFFPPTILAEQQTVWYNLPLLAPQEGVPEGQV
jgi:hypothetical protein